MENEPFISVVMPVYNVEKHLCQAIDSILAQSISDYEIILVDDCSPDKCPEICDRYSNKYEHIKTIHLEKNGGLSNARNQGQLYAKGRYIFFMDSDDYVDAYLFADIQESLRKNPAKLVIFGLVEEYYDENNILKNVVKVQSKDGYYRTKESVRKNLWKLEEKTLLGYAWNKIYDLDYLNSLGIHFEDITLIEDITFNIEYTKELDSMNVLSIAPYHYNRRLDQSLTHKFVKEYFALHYKRVRLLYDEYAGWGLLDAENERFFGNRLFRYILSALERNCDKNSKMNLKMRHHWILKLYEDPWINRMLSKADYTGKGMNFLIYIIRNKKTVLALLCGRCIYIIKNIFPIFFSKIKQR